MSLCKISKKPLEPSSRRFKRAERGLSAFWVKKKKAGGQGGAQPPRGGVGGGAEPPPMSLCKIPKKPPKFPLNTP